MPSVRLGFWLYLVNAWLIRVEARAAHNDFAAVFIPNRTIVAFVRSTNLAGERRVFHREQSIHYAAGGQTFFDSLGTIKRHTGRASPSLPTFLSVGWKGLPCLLVKREARIITQRVSKILGNLALDNIVQLAHSLCLGDRLLRFKLKSLNIHR
jgi:hypothetical protein